LSHAGKRSTRDYYMPATADRGVQELYWHLGKYSPDGIDFYSDALEEEGEVAHKPREVVLDRYNQHTKHCATCQVRCR
jgi:pheophorbide a oxygenase